MNTQVIVSIISVCIALLALWQTNMQIKLSNKQLLFDRRLKNYLLLLDFIKLYECNADSFNYKNEFFEEYIMYTSQFIFLTNVECLKDITALIDDYKNNDLRVNFLIKIEELKKLSKELRIIFPKKCGAYFSEYIDNYQETLMQLYKYSIFQQILENKARVRNENTKSSKEMKKQEDLLFEKFDKLASSYKKIQNGDVINKAEKTIKL